MNHNQVYNETYTTVVSYSISALGGEEQCNTYELKRSESN